MGDITELALSAYIIIFPILRLCGEIFVALCLVDFLPEPSRFSSVPGRYLVAREEGCTFDPGRRQVDFFFFLYFPVLLFPCGYDLNL